MPRFRVPSGAATLARHFSGRRAGARPVERPFQKPTDLRETPAPARRERSPMLENYAPLLILLALALGFSVSQIVLSEIAGRRRQNVGKGDAYECGMEPQGGARIRLSIHFYLLAVLFILFDVESVFLVLWAVASKGLEAQGLAVLVFGEIATFVLILALALAYVWRKGGLEWDR
jgi:NADH-quinone oxidoreductase subunit A